MSEFYDQCKERFIRYAKVDTQSVPGAGKVPSTEKQWDLANMLADEMRAMGVQNVWQDEYCNTYGTIPSTMPDGGGISLGFLGHIDTASEASGTNVKPWVLENYDGGDILLNKEENIVLEAAKFPRMAKYVGDDLILTDGTTLLGGDDKAAVTSIMTMAEYYCKHPEVPHGPIQICFTSDEEVGLLGASKMDIPKFGADLAYTLDGDGLGEFIYENFNGEEIQLRIHGVAVHPGTAKNIMKNAITIGNEFLSMLPAFERPEHTEEREGYYHPLVFEGDIENAFIRAIIRDHDKFRFSQRHDYLEKCVAALNAKYGEGTVEHTYTGRYSSMLDAVMTAPYMVDYARQAMAECGIEMKCIPMRGGTDGAFISQKGLPCPNISAGYENAHGRFEMVSIQSLEKNVEIMLHLIAIYTKHEAK
ncbi:MAG: peptidase T [Eubacteriales bacterium]|nr:peptidase T [Eubacteriales bacterium]